MADSGKPLVLVVDDESPIRRYLRAALTSQGFRVELATTGEEARVRAAAHPPDLVLLDLGLPDLDGLAVTRALRKHSAVPVIVLSARGQEADKIAALDAGADDYVTKPFATGELLARMRAALRRAATAPEASGDSIDQGVFEAGDLRIDRTRRRVTVGGDEVKLTPNEYRLLATLSLHAGRVLTHRFLLREVWGPGSTEQHHYLRVYMAQLRHKIEKNPARPRHLVTETGVGYRLRDD